MKKYLVLLLTAFVFTSCLKEGSNYIKYSGYINVDSMVLPDTAIVGQTVDVYVLGGAPNGCWYGLDLQLQNQGDSLVTIFGTGTYESTDGICTDIYPIVDTIFSFKPVDTGLVRFVAISMDNEKIKDSLVVLPSGR